MVELLVLVRHGAAEVCPDDSGDMSRGLTMAGRQSLKAMMPHVRSLIDSDGDVMIWSSPAACARQTATVVAHTLGIKPVEIRQFLCSQDVDAFFHELSSADARVVVAVGHDPLIEQAARRLDEDTPRLDEGAVAAFRLTGGLAWFVQGPDTAPWEVSEHVERSLFTMAGHVETCLRTFLDDPDDPETLHRYRVAIRTMRSLLVFIRPYQQSRQARLLADDLHELVRPTSRLRELDILCEQVEALEIERSATEPTLLSHCQELRATERRRAIKTLRSKETRRDIRQIVHESKNVRWKRAHRRSGLPLERLRARLDGMRMHLVDVEDALDLSDAAATHALRKDVKCVRYVTSELGNLLGADLGDVSSEMARAQDKLGVLCDARANRAIIATIDTAGLSTEAALELGLLDAQQAAVIGSILDAGSTT